MANRAFQSATTGFVTVLFLAVWGAAGAYAAESESEATPELCMWGGTPLDNTVTFRIKPGLTLTPAERELKIVATGPGECSHGFAGDVTFDGVIHAGGTCAVQVLEGKVKGLPGVTSALGHGAFGVIDVSLYDKDGNVVGSAQPQLWSGIGQGSEAPDCATTDGFTHGVFSSTVELWDAP
jgi:hypothetical protein